MADAAHPVAPGANPARPVYPLPSRRETAYAYQCNNCKRCCHDKLIQVNPYEVTRLAQQLGVSTGDFARDCLEDNVYLKRRANGACIFLDTGGCNVHPNRPMVCRIYPLGRHVAGDGSESFTHLDPHPQSEGRYGLDKTVQDYLEQQGAPEYMAAADRYLELFHRLHAALMATLAQQPGLTHELNQVAQSAKIDIPPWLDVDCVVDAYCTLHGLAAPQTLSEKMELHIAAIEAWLDKS